MMFVVPPGRIASGVAWPDQRGGDGVHRAVAAARDNRRRLIGDGGDGDGDRFDRGAFPRTWIV